MHKEQQSTMQLGRGLGWDATVVPLFFPAFSTSIEFALI
jgi:hypothetical protein